MKKKSEELKREAQSPVTLEFMREFRAEMISQFAAINARFERVDARFEQIDAKFDEVKAEFAQVRAEARQSTEETKASVHQVKLLVEEQNLRNKQSYDGYAITYGALEDLKSRIKPECLE